MARPLGLIPAATVYFAGLALLFWISFRPLPRPDPSPARYLDAPKPAPEPESSVTALKRRDPSVMVFHPGGAAAPEPPRSAVPLFRGKPAEAKEPDLNAPGGDIITPLNIRDPAALVMPPAAPESAPRETKSRRHPLNDAGTALPVREPGASAPGQPAGESEDRITVLNASDPSAFVSAPFTPESPAERRERLRRERVRAKAVR